MNCKTIRSHLPDYVRATLPEAEARVIREHLECCQACRRDSHMETALTSQMAERFAISPPTPDFDSRVFRNLTPSTRRHVHVAWGGAVAAALALGVFFGQSGLWQAEPIEPGATTVAEWADAPVTAPVETTVRLAFNAGEPLDDVTLTLSLPPHVELSGLPGQHRVRWQVSLEQGDNVLALPLRILFPGAGELVAELDAEGRQKVFRASIPSYPGATRSSPLEDEEPTT